MIAIKLVKMCGALSSTCFCSSPVPLSCTPLLRLNHD
jgi:hypothetical protein